MSLSFTFSQAGAAAVAMISNFTLNNALTYRDMRLKGWLWGKGLISFMLACSLGAFANIGVASYLFKRNAFWTLSALAGNRAWHGLELCDDGHLHLGKNWTKSKARVMEILYDARNPAAGGNSRG